MDHPASPAGEPTAAGPRRTTPEAPGGVTADVLVLS
jgi:hypothetical protein